MYTKCPERQKVDSWLPETTETGMKCGVTGNGYGVSFGEGDENVLKLIAVMLAQL